MIKRNLPPILHDRIDVLFIPLNPPPISNENGHYFSREPTFWNILKQSGLITREVTDDLLTADDRVFRQNTINFNRAVYGIHDLIIDRVEASSKSVHPTKTDIARISSILQTNRVKILCIMHSKVYRAFLKMNLVSRKAEYGLIGNLYGSTVFRVPFPSTRKYNASSIIEYYSGLRRLLEDTLEFQ